MIQSETQPMRHGPRQDILDVLSRPGKEAEMLIERHLGFLNGAQGRKPHTQSIELQRKATDQQRTVVSSLAQAWHVDRE